MPWIAKLLYRPKLGATSFPWKLWDYYHVAKKEGSELVMLQNLNGDATTITRREANHLFGRPEWVESYDAATVNALLIKDNEAKIEDDLKQHLKGNI